MDRLLDFEQFLRLKRGLLLEASLGSVLNLLFRAKSRRFRTPVESRAEFQTDELVRRREKASSSMLKTQVCSRIDPIGEFVEFQFRVLDISMRLTLRRRRLLELGQS
jgi:hypothetical protein